MYFLDSLISLVPVNENGNQCVLMSILLSSSLLIGYIFEYMNYKFGEVFYPNAG